MKTDQCNSETLDYVRYSKCLAITRVFSINHRQLAWSVTVCQSDVASAYQHFA